MKDCELECAKLCYDAYCKEVDNKSFDGEELKPFELLPENIQKAWLESYRASVLHYIDIISYRNKRFKSMVTPTPTTSNNEINDFIDTDLITNVMDEHITCLKKLSTDITKVSFKSINDLNNLWDSAVKSNNEMIKLLEESHEERKRRSLMKKK